MSIQRIIAAAIVMTATLAWSQTSPEEHAAHHAPDKPAATTAASATAAPARMMGDSHADIAQLRGLIEKAEHARTVAERERLLAEHLTAMRKQLDGLGSGQCSMEEKKGMAQGTESGDGAKPGMMDGGMKGDQMMMCHAMMKARMETMAELLAQTWRREELRRK
jgi:hypothetical protein